MDSSPAIVPDGTIYFGSNDAHLYALSPEGALRWRFNTRGAVTSSPAVGDEGTVYVGSSSGTLYALSPTGEEKWEGQGRALDRFLSCHRDGWYPLLWL
ncbi:MAG: PQQ-binding-like beta-propeller repeat protein [Candidatus Brocadiales bacterium]